MSEFVALSMLGASADQLKKIVEQMGTLPHIGNQRFRVVVDPTQITLAAQLVKDAQLPVMIISVAGYPTGRHHTLIKASEARLAVQSGAEEIWVSVDNTIADSNTHLSELIAISEACPDPVQLGLIAPLSDAPTHPAAHAAIQAARQVGFKRIIATQGSPELAEIASPLEFHVVDL